VQQPINFQSKLGEDEGIKQPNDGFNKGLTAFTIGE
jgi:hypothetical protein